MKASEQFTVGQSISGTFSCLRFDGEVVGFSFDGHCLLVKVANPHRHLPVVNGVLCFNPISKNIVIA